MSSSAQLPPLPTGLNYLIREAFREDTDPRGTQVEGGRGGFNTQLNPLYSQGKQGRRGEVLTRMGVGWCKTERWGVGLGEGMGGGR